jgi:MFS family permease
MNYFASRVEPFVRAFIISDALLYSSLNLINLLFVAYVTATVPGGTISSATTAIAIGLATRAAVELGFGKVSSRLHETTKLRLVIAGMTAISISYAGFAFSSDIITLTILWVINGIGWAIGHPAKLALVAKYVNHGQASQEWGLTDALNMILVIIVMMAGTFVVAHFSFSQLFMLAAVINALGLIPYLSYQRIIARRPLQNKEQPLGGSQTIE